MGWVTPTEIEYKSDGSKLSVEDYDNIEARFAVDNSYGVYIPYAELDPLIDFLQKLRAKAKP